MTDTQRRALIIGAGVAGVSAAIWLSELGVPFDWVESDTRIGGTLHRVHNPIDNHAGARFETGTALALSLEAHLRARGLWPQLGVRAQDITASAIESAVQTTLEGARDGSERIYGAVIVATGAARKTLGLEGELTHLGRGVASSGRAERDRFGGRHVVVVGGGDAAFENALLLREVGATVTLVHRNSDFRARREFVEPALSDPGIEILTHARLVDIEGHANAPFLDAVTLVHEGTRRRVPTEGLLVRIGEGARTPKIRLFGHQPALIGETFLETDPQGRTRHPRVLAAGDCACADFRAVSVAAGQGAVAAKTASRILLGRP